MRGSVVYSVLMPRAAGSSMYTHMGSRASLDLFGG